MGLREEALQGPILEGSEERDSANPSAGGNGRSSTEEATEVDRMTPIPTSGVHGNEGKSRELFDVYGLTGASSTPPTLPPPVLPTPAPGLCLCPAHWVLSSGARIVEANPRKFRIEASELMERRAFVRQMRDSVKEMRDHISSPSALAFAERKNREVPARSPPPERYGQLREELVSANSRYIEEQQLHQQLIIDQQDEQLELVSGSIRVLKHMSGRVGDELDEQSLMLEEFAQEMDSTQSRMDGVLKKMAKVSHMTSDRRQWCVIGILLVLLIVVLILFFTL
ncbi:syntaxin-10 [Terrapene carolina triunguis]|uniref:syntaxin-10 n=1 Tax=Terrapene triunguis TaxID=2587831 RepID=UPI000E778A04|nr:syntaxin-10 [Terrapene carolina triunguis]